MIIRDDLLPYNDRLELRDPATMELVVLHCTELPDLKEAREYGEKVLYSESGTGNSGHFYVDRDGTVYRWVREERIAHHVIGHNRNSLGIELVNRGRYPDWYSTGSQAPTDPYPPAQTAALMKLLKYLKQQYPWIRRLACHSDLDTQLVPSSDAPSSFVRRKIDPGPLFPWRETLTFWQSL